MKKAFYIYIKPTDEIFVFETIDDARAWKKATSTGAEIQEVTEGDSLYNWLVS